VHEFLEVCSKGYTLQSINWCTRNCTEYHQSACTSEYRLEYAVMPKAIIILAYTD